MDDGYEAFEVALMDRLDQVYGGRKWILAGGVVQGVAGGVNVVRSLGGEAIAVACRVGVGDIPDDVQYIVSDDARVGDDASMIERMHDSNRELHNLPSRVVTEIDAWDPEKKARAIVEFTIDQGQIAGRDTFGARRPEWAALEDKIAIREIWQQAGIPTAPDRVVATDDLNALLAAHDDLGTNLGTVWAVDNDQGWHGGGSGTHWISSHEHATEFARELNDRHHQVRIQPFLEGVPCSIHGLVLTASTLAFRPCEMLVLIDRQKQSFHYARAATFWDPSDADRQAMQAVARSIGDSLRDAVDFRGVFTVDGVLTAEGFRPTEVNPRFGAALPPRIPLSDGRLLRLFFTHLAAVEGHLDDLDSAQLEQVIVAGLDEQRLGTAMIFTDDPPPSNTECQLDIAGTWTGGAMADLRVAPEGSDEGFASASWGVNPGGGLIFITLDNLPTGPTVAPTLVTLRKFLSDMWDLNLAHLTPPFD